MTASRRRRHGQALIPIWFATLSVAGPALAAESAVAPRCPLHAAPAPRWISRALDCRDDEDANGLDDAVETELALCFVPEFAFDSAENARRPDEPHVFFSARPLARGVVRLRFAVLFARDGGYVLGVDFPCLPDDHRGDAESVEVDVQATLDGDHWYATPLAMHTIGPPGLSETRFFAGSSDEVPELAGTHPILYATAGKHHWLHHTAALRYACNCGPFGKCGSVSDRADGLGTRVTPGTVYHAPGFYREEQPRDVSLVSRSGWDTGLLHGYLRSQTPVEASGQRWWNACEFATRGVLVPAERSLWSNDLGVLGYPGEHLFGACFRGGYGGPCTETVSVAEALAWDDPFTAMTGERRLISLLLGGRKGISIETAVSEAVHP
jgi:hypothetical protein